MNTMIKQGLSFVMLPIMVFYMLIPNDAAGDSCSMVHEKKFINHGFLLKENPYKYSSGYQDSESSLYYLKARYYSPKLMRFISRDTYDLSNRYSYCDSNPISMIDPGGHSAFDWIGLGAAIFFTAATMIPSGGTSPWITAAFIVGNCAAPAVSLAADISKNNTKGIVIDSLLLASSICGAYSAQPTYFDIGRDGCAAKAQEVARRTKEASYAVTRMENWQTISSLSSQGLAGAAGGVGASDDNWNHAYEMAAVGFGAGLISGMGYSYLTNRLAIDKTKYIDSMWKGAVRTSLNQVVQAGAISVASLEITNRKWKDSDWVSLGENLGAGIILGAYSGWSQVNLSVAQSSNAGSYSRFAAGSRNAYLFLKTPIIQKLLSDKITDYGNFSF